jgi:hypothetical protein
MRELILSDITEMGSGQCIVGIERVGENAFRSVRPMPPIGYAWPAALGYERGDCVRFEDAPTAARPPHVEDQNTHGLTIPVGDLDEDELVDLLQHAETCENVQGLFGCELHSDQLGGNAWVPPGQASRSICGCSYVNMRFRTFIDAGKVRLMAMLALTSGEVLHSLPIVDWAWRQFLAEVVRRSPHRPNRKDVDAFFNRNIRAQVMDSPLHFVRLGLPRPRQDENKCWLMLDSLFPQPDAAWLEVGEVGASV